MEHQFADAVLEGAGVRLSPLGPGDVDDVTAGCRDELTQRWLPLPSPYTHDVARAFIEDIAPGMHASGAGIVRRIEVGGRLCGVIDLKKTDWRARTTEIGYWVAPWGRGRGLAGRASKLLADWALSEQGMARVVIHCAVGNMSSQRAAVSAGFTREGVARSAGIVHAGRVDLVVFGKVSSDLDVA
ncbi:GNAT family N-acetyltransferase [Nocardioides flavus (ex Wang et al. 2016)]|uniref:GNAT family N-acetyltransferase n=1 Tax=Nocardioides flavus (ex Wang et al. 2016) TaxID=2058780 RepID=UPI00174DE866|nr:GNAT family protein [Nocardioides flavus (ex Wang et al. 2016)]